MTNIQVAAVGLVVVMWSSTAHATDPCKDCDPATGLTIQETIRAARAKDAKRVADEPVTRPWDATKVFGTTGSRAIQETIRAERAKDAKRAADEPVTRPWDASTVSGTVSLPSKPDMIQ